MNTNTQANERRRSLWKGPALFAALILIITLLGNHFVDGWNWHPGGFVVVGTLVFGLGFAYQLVTRNRNAIAFRTAVVMALATGFMLFWGNLVQFADVNRAAAMYFAVLIVGIIGAAISRLRPAGMARALFATALAQAVVLAIALIVRDPEVTPWSAPVLRGFGGNACSLVAFVGSALLFRRAAREGSVPAAA